MVRPIDLSDSVNKAELVQRLQQNQKVQPEAAQHFQKTYTEKLTEQVTTPNPVPKDDEVFLHVDERDEERKKVREDEEQSRREKKQKDEEAKKNDDDDNDKPIGHIDITF